MSDKTNVTKELSKLKQSILILQKKVYSISQVSQATTSTRSARYWHYFVRGLGLVADASSLIIPVATIYLAFSNFISIPTTHSLQLNDPLTIFVVTSPVAALL